MGAAASKKCNSFPPVKPAIVSDNLGEVSGPDATIVVSSVISVTSSLRTSIFSWYAFLTEM